MRVLHLLGWKLCDIESNLEEISEQGFDGIQINPIQPLKDENRDEWWMSYQPIDFSIGNKYGSKEDLVRLCSKAREYNITIICDVVCNHMGNNGEDSYNSLIPNDKVSKRLTERNDFWKERRNITDWNDRYQVTHYCMGLPGLNLANHDLQDIIIEFLRELIDCGVDGFRFDAAKSIALPNENIKYGWNEDSCDFWPRVIYSLNKWGLTLYGEVIFSNEELVKEYQKYLCVLTDSFCENRDKTFNYIESHDSYLGMGYTRFKSSLEVAIDYKNRALNYDNTLFYARPFDDTWKSNIIKEANMCNIKRLNK